MFKAMIAVDGSEPARRGLEALARWAQVLGAGDRLQCVLVNVREPQSLPGSLPPSAAQSLMESHARQAQESLLVDAREHARALGLAPPRLYRAQGDAAPGLLRALEHEHPDVLVMGTRGLSALGSLLMGSVAQKVVHASTVPVLLVR